MGTFWRLIRVATHRGASDRPAAIRVDARIEARSRGFA